MNLIDVLHRNIGKNIKFCSEKKEEKQGGNGEKPEKEEFFTVLGEKIYNFGKGKGKNMIFLGP